MDNGESKVGPSGSLESRPDNEPGPSTSHDSRPYSEPGPSTSYGSRPDSEPGPSTSYGSRPDSLPSTSVSNSRRHHVIPDFDHDRNAPELKPEDQGSIPNQDGPEISKDNVLKGWTKDEKFEFMQALKFYGPSDIDSIQESVPSKSADDITAALKYYKAIANARLKAGQIDQSKIKQSTPRHPLAGWAKYLTDRLEYDELRTETPDTLRLIAEFEKIPLPVHTGNIDFRGIYRSIADAMEGKPIVTDKLSAMVLDQCISECSMLSARFLKTSQLKNIIDQIDVNKKATTATLGRKDGDELRALRHLVAQTNYNPLNIEEQHLKAHK